MSLSMWRRAAGVLVLGVASTVVLAQTAPGKAAPRKPTTPARPASAAEAPAKAPLQYTIGPMPAWVVPVPLPGGAPSEAAPMHYRLIDDQYRVETGNVTAFSRVVRVVNQASGLAQASQIELEFDPSYQTLMLHRLDLVRDGQRIGKLDRKRIELLQREKQLEQRVYDGRLTASIVVDDVRVGDEIEFAYSLSGQNPVFGGRFVELQWMTSQRGPVRLYQTRLLAPETRDIRIAKGPSDATTSSRVVAGQRETVLRRENVVQLRPEPASSFATVLPELVQFSEFADWAEVAAWGERLFAGAALGPNTAAQAAVIRAAHAEPAEQVREALRFVQQEVRYFGIEIGPGTHKPHAADQVLQQRFGDCKDKVTLLSALLQNLQVPVRPVLVSTRLRGQVDRMLPSPLAFDHVIARVEVDGRPLWLDPTRSHQSGPLHARQVVGLGRGLELASGSSALASLPTPYDSERLRVEDRIVVTRFVDAPTLESRVIYRGDAAEWIRESLATQGLAPVADAVGSPYLKAYPKARRLAPAEAQPVPDDDAIAVVQRFALDDFWRFPEQRVLIGDIVQWSPVDALLPPKSESRRQAMSFAMPGLYRHRVRVEFPEDVYQQPSSRRSDDGDSHFSLSTRVEATRNAIDYNAEVRIAVDQVDPAQWAGFSAAVNKALPKLGTVVAISAVSLPRIDALQAELRKLEDDLRRQRVKAVTSTQARSQFQVATLTAQIDGGRLAPALRAQTLVARGTALDHLGRLDAARDDFEAALALDKDSLDALNAAAVNAQARGDADLAVELTTQVLARQPRDGAALHTRALSQYLAGRLDQARADWDALLSSDGAALRRGYPLVLLALATRRAGQDPAPLLQKYPREQWPTEWPRPVLDALFDAPDSAAVLRAAKASQTPLEAQTEAHFYLGERAAADGDLRTARDQWKRAMDLQVVEFVEFNAARQRLAQQR